MSSNDAPGAASMWCPRCWAEFVPGMLRCSDCGAALTASVPPELVDHERRSGRRRAILGGAAFVAGVIMAAWVASWIVYVRYTDCGGGSGQADAGRALRRAELMVWSTAALPLALRAVFARTRRRRAWPWGFASGALLTMALLEGVGADPTALCSW